MFHKNDDSIEDTEMHEILEKGEDSSTFLFLLWYGLNFSSF